MKTHQEISLIEFRRMVRQADHVWVRAASGYLCAKISKRSAIIWATCTLEGRRQCLVAGSNTGFVHLNKRDLWIGDAKEDGSDFVLTATPKKGDRR